MPKLVGKSNAASVAELLPQRGIAGKLRKSRGERSNVSRRNENPGLAGDADFPRTIDVVTDDGLAGDQRLGECSRQSFPQAGMNQNVDRAEQFRNLCRRHETGELKVLLQTCVINLLL